MGATYDEFKTMLTTSWEIECAFEGHEYLYQRSGKDGLYEMYVLRDREVVFHEKDDSADALANKVLALRIYNGKTALEAQGHIVVLYEA